MQTSWQNAETEDGTFGCFLWGLDVEDSPRSKFGSGFSAWECVEELGRLQRDD